MGVVDIIIQGRTDQKTNMDTKFCIGCNCSRFGYIRHYCSIISFSTNACNATSATNIRWIHYFCYLYFPSVARKSSQCYIRIYDHILLLTRYKYYDLSSWRIFTSEGNLCLSIIIIIILRTKYGINYWIFNWQTFSDLIFLLCVNFFGVYVRLQSEVEIRRAFLDRRECVEGNLLLRSARDQEVSIQSLSTKENFFLINLFHKFS